MRGREALVRAASVLLLLIGTQWRPVKATSSTPFNYTEGPSFREYDRSVPQLNPFSQVSSSSTYGNPHFCGDFDGDGDDDCLIHEGTGLKYFRNDLIGDDNGILNRFQVPGFTELTGPSVSSVT